MPKNEEIIDHKPSMHSVEDTKPKMEAVFDAKPSVLINTTLASRGEERTLGAGMPIGLLLTLTYPEEITVTS